MTTSEWITAIVVFGIAGILAIISVNSFREHGFLLNNAYLYASKEERERMDKKPYYRQTGIVFLLLSLIFVIIGASVVFHSSKLNLLEIPVAAGAVIYAVVSSVRIEAGKKK